MNEEWQLAVVRRLSLVTGGNSWTLCGLSGNNLHNDQISETTTSWRWGKSGGEGYVR